MWKNNTAQWSYFITKNKGRFFIIHRWEKSFTVERWLMVFKRKQLLLLLAIRSLKKAFNASLICRFEDAISSIKLVNLKPGVPRLHSTCLRCLFLQRVSSLIQVKDLTLEMDLCLKEPGISKAAWQVLLKQITRSSAWEGSDVPWTASELAFGNKVADVSLKCMRAQRTSGLTGLSMRQNQIQHIYN